MKQSNRGLNIIVYRDYIGHGAAQFRSPNSFAFEFRDRYILKPISRG